MAMAGRSIAVARCSMPTRSASSTSPIACRSTPGRPTIPRSSRRRCSSNWRRNTRPLRRWRRQRKRLDGGKQRGACSPPPCGEGLGVGVNIGGADAATPLPDPPPQGGREQEGRVHLTSGEAPMMHPGEQFYPEGIHWNDPIARGSLPDVLSKAAAKFEARPALEFRDRTISYRELEQLTEVAASAFLRAGY